jgi:secreted Zn-dependent insulinase-like peptidase
MKHGKAIAAITGFVLILIAGAIYWQQHVAQQATNPSNIEISDYETRVFKSITLKNGLKVILVSDPESDKAAAAMNVFSGSWENPPEVPGLAHFLEHMLFLGTEKYPEADEYSHFMQTNGGSDNAYTSAENTLYFFNINAGQYEEALDRFSQFFIAPLLDSDFAQREINAVHSEYTASLQNDGRRIEDVTRELTNKNHPASRLAIGNLDTLHVDDLQEQLQSFFQQHYVASNMALAIYGPQQIETLEQWVTEYFTGIRDVQSSPVSYAEPQFEAQSLPLLVEIQPRREMRQLQFRFPLTVETPMLASNPTGYIASLISQRSSGSLYSVLKEKGWAEELYVSDGGLTYSTTTFNVSISLTPEGLENWQTIAEMLFSEIELIRQQGIQQWYYDEQQQINEIAFQFAEKVSASTTAITLAERLQYLEPKKLLSGLYRLPGFSPEEVETVLDQLKPDNALVLLTYPEAKTDKTSEFYRTNYSANQLTGNTVAAWRNASLISELQLPGANPFIPDDLTVQPLEKTASQLYKNIPHILSFDDHKTVWYEQDDQFMTPKVDIHLLLESQFMNQSPEQMAAVNLYLTLVDNDLQEIRYLAGVAGSGYGINLSDNGVQVRLYGYQEKLGLLLDALIVELTNHEIDPVRFQLEKDKYLRALKNRSEDPVLNQMIRTLNNWLLSNSFNTEALIAAVETLEPEDLINARNELFNSSFLTMLLHGNLTSAQAAELAERVDAVIPQQGVKTQRRTLAKLPQKNFLDNVTINHSDSAFLEFYQGDNSSLRERALYTLLAETINAPYFAELRTQEQLGYIVMARSYSIDGMPGIIFYIQSPNTDAALLQLYSDRFLSRYSHQLASMNEQQFLQYKEGIMTTLTQPDQNLYELSDRYWSNIVEGNPHFNTRTRLAYEIEKISLDGFRRFFENKINGDQARSLSMHQISNAMKGDYAEHAVNLVGLYPLNEPKEWPDDITWITPAFNNLTDE